MSDNNPFAAPTGALVSDSKKQTFELEPQKRSFRDGGQWIITAFDLFKSAVGLWIAFAVALFGMQFLLSILPFGIGNLLMSSWNMVAVAGGVWVAKKYHEGDEAQFGDFFIGLKVQTKELVLAGLGLMLGALVVIVIIAIITMIIGGVMGTSVESLFGESAGSDFSQFATLALIVGLLAMLLFMPIVMAGWFAPALIIFHEVPVMEAFKSSIKACLANISPFLLYGLLLMLLGILGIMTFGLGLLVVWPVLMISYYTAFRSIYYRDEQ